MTRVVDIHAHVVVPGLGAEVAWEDGKQVVRFAGKEMREHIEHFGSHHSDAILTENYSNAMRFVACCVSVMRRPH